MYRVRLDQFEGPLDLLLFFIRRDELDIYDIPIAQITDEFLSYVRLIEQIDLDNAGEFIYVAALLISIKARLLLPSPELDDEGEPIDPRQELVERLLEYVRYKEASGQLEARYDARADLFTRGDGSAEATRDAVPEPEQPLDASLFDLVAALRRILTEAPSEPVHAVERLDYSVEGQRTFVLERLRPGERVRFGEMVRQQTKPFVIATFLAVLELACLGSVQVTLAPTALDFYLVRRPPSDEALSLPDDHVSGDGL
ncbi:MAG: segregation and condensation protein A [Rhodothermales bacterium]